MTAQQPPEGTHVTYAEDPVFPGDWFCDLRDSDGNVIETGSGTTREAARARLLERRHRRQAEAADRERNLIALRNVARILAAPDKLTPIETVELIDAEVSALDLGEDEPPRGTQAYADKYASRTVQRELLGLDVPDDLEDAAAQDDDVPGEPFPGHGATVSTRLGGDTE